jgi:hypothetical protein
MRLNRVANQTVIPIGATNKTAIAAHASPSPTVNAGLAAAFPTPEAELGTSSARPR